MVFCGDCLMWAHLGCDRIFNVPSMKASFDIKMFSYNCCKCRSRRRNDIIIQLIEKVSSEDKYFFFQEPVEEQVPNYTKIVKQPMCFKYVREKASTSNVYLMNPDQLRQDIQLIF
jgi:hypothetical protein